MPPSAAFRFCEEEFQFLLCRLRAKAGPKSFGTYFGLLGLEDVQHFLSLDRGVQEVDLMGYFVIKFHQVQVFYNLRHEKTCALDDKNKKYVRREAENVHATRKGIAMITAKRTVCTPGKSLNPLRRISHRASMEYCVFLSVSPCCKMALNRSKAASNPGLQTSSSTWPTACSDKADHKKKTIPN